MQQDLRDLLLGDAGVSVLTGPRISWGVRPQGSDVPAVTLSLVSSDQGMSLSGPDRLIASRVQVDCRAAEYGQASDLWKAVDAALDGYAGSGANVVFQGIFADGARELHELNAVPPLFRFSADFLTVHHLKG